MIANTKELFRKLRKRTGLLLLASLLALCLSPFAARIWFNSIPAPELTIKQVDLILVRGPILDLRPQAIKLNKLVKAGHQKVYIVINSGGGSLQAGSLLVDRIKAASYRNVNVVCIVDGMAASMALIIMSHCSERYGMFGSYIMWHSAAYSGLMRINDNTAGKLIEDLAMINDSIWIETRMYFWPWYFREHYKKETMLSVTSVEENSFGFLKVLTKVNLIKADKVKVKITPKLKSRGKIKNQKVNKNNINKPKLSPLQRGY